MPADTGEHRLPRTQGLLSPGVSFHSKARRCCTERERRAQGQVGQHRNYTPGQALPAGPPDQTDSTFPSQLSTFLFKFL